MIVLAVVGVLFLGETMNWPQRLSIPLALLGLALLLGLHESGLPEDGTRGVALGFVIELKGLGGRSLLPGYNVFSLVEY